MAMPIPTKFKLKDQTWTVATWRRADDTRQPFVYGTCHFALHHIDIFKRPGGAYRQGITFWHEAVHAMLDSMTHPRAKRLVHDERFVDELGRLIAEMTRTARF